MNLTSEEKVVMLFGLRYLKWWMGIWRKFFWEFVN